ncbi:rhomboid family intramembrane serine protease [Tessaracoccus sp. Z1128]
MSVEPVSKPTLSRALVIIGGLLAVMWVLEIVDAMTLNSLDYYGIEPRQAEDLPNILLAPFLHYGWGHLIGNSLPFLVLGVLTYLAGVVRWMVASLTSVVTSGLAAWLLSPLGTITAGASGVIFGWLAYLLVRGIFSGRPGQIAIAVVVFLLYGSVLWGVFPTAAGVSWQAHLGGAVGGVAAAWQLHRRRDSAPV